MAYSEEFISIIMPTHNSEAHIAESILSIQAQTWTKWELIIIDDCSTDGTTALILSFAKNDSRIKNLRNELNSGAASSRNKGIKHASGTWIAFLDSDDCWDASKLERQIAFAYKKNAVFTFTGSYFMDNLSRLWSHQLHVPDTVNFHQLLKQNVISCSSVLIKKDILLDFPTTSNKLHEDFIVWLKILRTHNIYAYGLDLPLLIYRVSATSRSGNKLKAAGMTFRVYRHINLPFHHACYFWLCYVIKSLKKYIKLLKSGGR